MYRGTVNVNEIKLFSKRYTKNHPSEKTMKKRRLEYQMDHKLYITVREGTKELLDGYTYFIIAKELKLNNVECNYVGKNEEFLTPANSISKDNEIKNKIFKRDNYRCYICGQKIETKISQDNVDLGTVDHVLPRAKGGCGNLKNLRCCCRFCNNLKSDLPLTDDLKNFIKSEKEIVIKNNIKTVSEYKEYKKGRKEVC